MTKTIYILNGPNLNMLGTREPDVYGSQSLDDIGDICSKRAQMHGFDIEFRQSNVEGELVNWVQEAGQGGAALIINAGAYTHTSVALLDALKAVSIPAVEVHLSNIFQREEFRHHSFISQAALGVICGFGANGYELAIDAIAQKLES